MEIFSLGLLFFQTLLQEQTMKNQNMIRYFERYFVHFYSSKRTYSLVVDTIIS